MGASFDLRLQTDLSPREVLEIVARDFGIEPINISSQNSIRVPETAVSAVGTDYISENGKNLMKDSYGFLHNVSINFADYSGKVAQNEQDNRIAKGIVTVLKKVSGDAVILYNGEQTVAQRINGNLLLQDKNYAWIATELDKSNLKYIVKTLKSPLME